MIKLPPKKELLDKLPIQHISYSAVKSYCQDQNAFYKGYILGERDAIEVKPSYVIGTAVHYGIEQYWNSVKDETPFDQATVTELALEKARKHIKQAEKDGNMERGVTQDQAYVEKIISETMEAYLDNPPKYKPLFTEIDDKVEFTDFDGTEMPLPLKVKIDMIAEDENGDVIIIDHKTTSAGYEKQPDAIAPDFDLQAGAYFIGCMSITGKQPKKMIFDQIFKGKPNVFKGLLQKDLRELCDKHGITWEKKHKNDDLKKMLLEADVMEKPETILRYEINFEENLQAVKAFIQLYKYIVLDVYQKQLNDLPYIVNPFKQFGAELTYTHWLKSLA